MSARASAWLAWSLAGLSVAMFVASVVVYVLVRSSQEGPSTSGALSELLIFVSFLAFPILGALIASKHPKNPVGWICLVIGLFWMRTFLGDSIPAPDLTRDDRRADPGDMDTPVGQLVRHVRDAVHREEW